MACCSILLLLMSRLAGLHSERPARRRRQVLAAVCAGVIFELLLAWWLAYLLAGSAPHASHHMHRAASASGVPAQVAAAIVVVLLTLWVYAASRSPAAERPRAPVWTAGVIATAVAFSGPLTRAAETSHLAAMAQLELLTTLAPVLLVRGWPERSRSSSLPTALAAAGLWSAVVYLWHIPAVHHADFAGAAVLMPLSYLCAGLLLWRCAGERPAVLLAAQEAVALLGLALLLAPSPLYGTALADQRAAGVLMMLVDSVVLAVLLLRLTGRSFPRPRPPAPPTPARRKVIA
ncbi:cytochrome c oxidase assembly protein [Streptomyces capitiformicae]|uniref:Uncharacterized protein n=1 Tax=Streptomyces capitiformicae TaxID=2014920 RepID=A0A918Z8X8_9ACTN|nr:cytochrome c oxidase assembly protein [Streptomyces capitiformicae]GHE41594.1 hypothetical protein GCM10017771_60900 [Streptomyces capitiformicae]